MVPHIYPNLWAFLPKPCGDLHTARTGAHDEGPSLPACLWSDPSNGVSPSLGGEGKLHWYLQFSTPLLCAGLGLAQ